MDKLFLSIPQWQGSGKGNEIYFGGVLLTKELSQLPFIKVDVKEIEHLELENNIWGYKSLKSQLQQARKIIEKENPQQIFTIGGGCDVEVIPVSYLNHAYRGDLAVVWIDAHGDLNTPESSPSNNLHGMPLRLLLGEGDQQLSSLTFSHLNPHQVFLFGVRDLDAPEKEYVIKNAILNTEDSSRLIYEITRKGIRNVYVHLDLDVLDPQEFPYVKVPTPQGLQVSQIIDLISKLKSRFTLVGGSVVEYVLASPTKSVSLGLMC